jgi:hypothetical protein
VSLGVAVQSVDVGLCLVGSLPSRLVLLQLLPGHLCVCPVRFVVLLSGRENSVQRIRLCKERINNVNNG